MENAHIITLTRWNFASAAVFEDWNKWSKASRTPLNMSSGGVLGIERCFSLQEKLIHLNTITLSYFENIGSFCRHRRGPQVAATEKDRQITWGDKIEHSWQAVFSLVRRFQSTGVRQDDHGNIVDKTTRLKEFPEGSEPVIWLRGLRFTSDLWRKYDDWCNDWGYDIYLPMLLKVPGLIEYDRFWLSPVNHGGFPAPEIIENPEYPQDLVISYFESLKAYQNFLKSKELAVFDRTLEAAFPGGLNYIWNVAYRVGRRWSR
jgi:hypothetical protein